jgi:hypothetical protein
MPGLFTQPPAILGRSVLSGLDLVMAGNRAISFRAVSGKPLLKKAIAS